LDVFRLSAFYVSLRCLIKVLSLRREAEGFNHGNHEGTRKNTEDLTTENMEYTEGRGRRELFKVG